MFSTLKISAVTLARYSKLMLLAGQKSIALGSGYFWLILQKDCGKKNQGWLQSLIGGIVHHTVHFCCGIPPSHILKSFSLACLEPERWPNKMWEEVYGQISIHLNFTFDSQIYIYIYIYIDRQIQIYIDIDIQIQIYRYIDREIDIDIYLPLQLPTHSRQVAADHD